MNSPLIAHKHTENLDFIARVMVVLHNVPPSSPDWQTDRHCQTYYLPATRSILTVPLQRDNPEMLPSNILPMCLVLEAHNFVDRQPLQRVSHLSTKLCSAGQFQAAKKLKGLRILATLEAKTPKISNFWTFCTVIMLLAGLQARMSRSC